MQHFTAQPVKNGEADVGSILSRIDVHPERPLAERCIYDFDDGVGNG